MEYIYIDNRTVFPKVRKGNYANINAAHWNAFSAIEHKN